MVSLADVPQEAIAREYLASAWQQRLLFDAVLFLEPDSRDHGEPRRFDDAAADRAAATQA
jgi:hypothetical protein